MSNHAHRRHHRPHRLDRSVLEAIARASARGRGCTCRPELELRHVDGIARVSICHDEWCPAINPTREEQRP